MARLKALLVGIDAYPAPVPPLAGCVNDVESMAQTLRARVPEPALDLLVLTDAQATRAAFVDAVRTHLAGAGPEDTALLYYSGHGSQQQAPQELWPSEPDRRNETLVLVDSRSPGGWDLADKELAGLLDTVTSSVGHLLVVLDCCHSGDGTRDANGTVRLRLAPEDHRSRPWDTFLPEASAAAQTVPVVAEDAQREATSGTRSAWAAYQRGHVLLAACRSSETAKETRIDGRQRGALSAALERALRDNGRPTYRELHRYVTSGVLARVEDQHPQLESTAAADLELGFLGDALPPRPRRLTLSHLPDGWSIDAGAVHGVPEPVGDDTTELAVYGLDAETDGAPLAEAVVTKVLPDRSVVTVTPALDEGFVYRAVVRTIPLAPVRVGVVGEAAAALREAAAAADATLVELVDEGEGADLVVRARPDGFEITRPGVTRPLVPVVAGDHREARTVLALERVARWLRLSALSNPTTQLAPGSVSVDVQSPSGGLGPDGRIEIRYAAGQAPAFTVTLANTTSRPLWCALLDLTETYGIFTDAFPSGSAALEPGASVQVALSGQVPDALWAAGTVSMTDQLKVVTSTLEFDPRSLEQPELDVSAVAPDTVVRGAREARSTLERLLVGVATRRLQPASGEAPPVADWRTDDVWIVTHRPRP